MAAAYLTHELRAPLTNLTAALDLLTAEAGRLSPDGRAHLSMAGSNAARLRRLVDDVLDYAKLLAGAMPLHRERVPASRLAEEAAGALRAAASIKGVDFAVDIPPALVVDADLGRIVQVLVNLLSNALKYSPPGGVIRVSARKDHAGTAFTVRDQGPGVPPAFRPSLFKAFAQAAASGTKLGGTGLGLTLARHFVRAHGGEIWLEHGAPGTGAAFSFLIPDRPPVARPEGPALWERLRTGCAAALAGALVAIIGKGH